MNVLLNQAVKETQMATAKVKALHAKVRNKVAKVSELSSALAELKDKLAKLKQQQTLSGFGQSDSSCCSYLWLPVIGIVLYFVFKT